MSTRRSRLPFTLLASLLVLGLGAGIYVAAREPAPASIAEPPARAAATPAAIGPMAVTPAPDAAIAAPPPPVTPARAADRDATHTTRPPAATKPAKKPAAKQRLEDDLIGPPL